MSVTVHQGAPALVAPVHQYLLFGGREPTVGGVAGLMAVFDSESEARHTFADLRRYKAGETTWAELCEVDTEGRVRILCSFGRGRPVRWTADLARSSWEITAPPETPVKSRFGAGVSRLVALHLAGLPFTNANGGPSGADRREPLPGGGQGGREGAG